MSVQDPEALQLPLVPLRDMVVFPSMMAPFVVGRRASILALEATLATNEKKIFLATQKDPKIDDPSMNEIHRVGVIATVVQNLKLPNQNVKVMVEGLARGEIVWSQESTGYMTVGVREVDTRYPVTPEVSQYMQKLVEIFEQYAKMSHHLAFEGVMATLKLDEPDRFADTLASHLLITTSEKQLLLETASPYERLQKLQDFLEIEIEKINIDKRINSKVKKQMERAQKEYYLNEKIKAIHHELGRKDDRSDEVEELRQKIEEAGMPKETKEKALQELKRLEAMPGVSAEATVSRNYIEWLVAVPWKKQSKEIRDIDLAEKILNEDHYGLEKIKERILEFLAVRQLVKQPKGTILCFVGPPGVGKTSLAKSIARATGRKFVRLSLGGVRDEAEIRGHRRTYIGAFPGQIIQRMKKAGTVNPVFLLDEVDKMAMDFRGDPSSALLEVLDPEQNNQFVDHYLDVEYDLSKVMFIATANVTHTIPPPLKDRMEVISLSGYTHLEKLAIGRQFLVPKQKAEQGLDEAKTTFDDSALVELIDYYTREAGVRNLEREIGSVLRKVARMVLQHGPQFETTVDRHEGPRAPRQAEVPHAADSGQERDRPFHRAGLDRGRRRDSLHRSGPLPRQGQPDADRQARRRHAGVGARGALLRPFPRRAVRTRSRLPLEHGHPHPRARGGDPERWSVGRHHHGHGTPFRGDPHPGTSRRGHDRRDHPPWQGAARRGRQGQDPGGGEGGHHPHHHAGGQ